MSSPSRATSPSVHQKRTRIDVRTHPASRRARDHCLSVYRESGWTWRCQGKAGHSGKHYGWSTGQSREWTGNQEAPYE